MSATKKRFHDANIWRDPWFVKLPRKEKMLWYYINCECDHGGIWSPIDLFFSRLVDAEVNIDDSLKVLNNISEHVYVLPNNDWLIINFFRFQYGKKMNLNNRVHASIKEIYMDHNVPLVKTGITIIENADEETASYVKNQNADRIIQIKLASTLTTT